MEVDILKQLIRKGYIARAEAREQVVGDMTLIAFYLLGVGGHAVKGTRDSLKQRKQFKLGDVTCLRRPLQANCSNYHV